MTAAKFTLWSAPKFAVLAANSDSHSGRVVDKHREEDGVLRDNSANTPLRMVSVMHSRSGATVSQKADDQLNVAIREKDFRESDRTSSRHTQSKAFSTSSKKAVTRLSWQPASVDHGIYERVGFCFSFFLSCCYYGQLRMNKLEN